MGFKIKFNKNAYYSVFYKYSEVRIFADSVRHGLRLLPVTFFVGYLLLHSFDPSPHGVLSN